MAKFIGLLSITASKYEAPHDSFSPPPIIPPFALLISLQSNGANGGIEGVNSETEWKKDMAEQVYVLNHVPEVSSSGKKEGHQKNPG